jgi:hypothetical protein
MSSDQASGLGVDSAARFIRLKTPMVVVRVEVKDRSGWYVFDLRRNDFTIYQDGIPQEMQYFTTEIADPDTPWLGYAVGYCPQDSTPDGRPRKIRVRVRDGKVRGLKARCYPSVYTPEPDQPQTP